MRKLRGNLATLTRQVMEDAPRDNYLRLDLNEVVPQFDQKTFDIILEKLEPWMFSSYPDLSRVYQSLGEYLKISEDHLLLTSGSDAGIRQVFQVFCEPKDTVVVTDPTFGMYWVYSQIFNLDYQKVNISADFKVNMDEFHEAISNPKAKLIVIANPNGAIGCVIPHQKLKQLICEASKNDVIVLLDETYIDFYHDYFSQEIDQHDNLIIVRSFSKAWGMAGLRFGYVLTNPELQQWLMKVDPYIEINGIAAHVANYLLNNPKVVHEYVNDAKAGGKYIVKVFKQLGFEVYFGNANFVLVKFGKRKDAILKELEKRKIKVMDQTKRELLREYTRITTGPKTFMEPVVDAVMFALSLDD